MSWVAVGVIGASAISSLLAPKPDTSGQQMAGRASEQLANISSDQWNLFKQNYAPLISDLTEQARQAGSPEAFRAALGRANADVTGAYDTARRGSLNRLQSYGINPSSGRYRSALNTSGLAEAASRAGAETSAWNRQSDLAYSRLADTLRTGMGLPGQAIGAASGAAGAAGVMQNAINAQSQQRAQNAYAAGQLGGALGGIAGRWYSQPSGADYTGAGLNVGRGAYSNFADGGMVNTPSHRGLKRRLMRGNMTHHMTPEVQDVEDLNESQGMVRGPGDGTSDSIPANIDGKDQANLSNGEFVMVAEVPKMSGEDILKAINQAGLMMRDKQEPEGYKCGGLVPRR